LEVSEKLKDVMLKTKKIRFKKIHIFNILWPIARTLLIIGMAYIILFPMLNMISKAFSGDYLAEATTVWIPKRFTTYNFVGAFKYLKYKETLISTIKLSIGSSILQLISCSLAGYGFARFKFKGREFLFGLVIFTIIVPSQTYIISMYLNFRFFDFFGFGKVLHSIIGIKSSVNLVNTYWTFWGPAMFGMGIRSGLFIYIFRQFFRGLPKDLEEAAKIDGCGAFKTFRKIMMPNATPAYLTVFLFSLVWHWNEYYVSNMMFQAKNEPLAVVVFRLQDFLRNLGSQNLTFFNDKYMLNASAILLVLPLVIIFIFAQKHFIESVDKVGVKG
jgi:multiple sugar transport system permease protein